MQKVAILSDIHGNLPALDAVLEEIAHEGIERIICLGDVVAQGAQPHEVITRLRGLECPVVMGNTDANVLTAEPDASVPGDDSGNDAYDRWCAAQLTDDDRVYLRSFQPTVSVSLDNGATLLCYHGSPRSFDERITAETPDEVLQEMLATTPAQLFAGGHTHQQFLRRHRDVLVLNPGTVGFAKDTILPVRQLAIPTGQNMLSSPAMVCSSTCRYAAYGSTWMRSSLCLMLLASPATNGAGATGGVSKRVSGNDGHGKFPSLPPV